MLLVGKAHDPAAVVSRSCAALIPLTVIDPALRGVFTVPPSGRVLVRMTGVLHGAATFPQFLLGLLDNATPTPNRVGPRVSPFGAPRGTALATTVPFEASWPIDGLTPGQEVTWDPAYSVELAVNATALKMGGPNNNVANDAFGAFTFEVWEA